MMNTQELLQILACPRCMGSLEPLPSAEHPEGLACPACNVVYPVRDDIPIMLVDAAVERARWDEKHKGYDRSCHTQSLVAVACAEKVGHGTALYVLCH